MTLHKVLKYLAIVVGVIGLILLGRIIWAGDEAIANSADLQSSLINPIMYVAYFVFVFIVVMVLVFVVVGLFRGNIKNTLISIGAFAVVLLIGYVLADGTRPPGLSGYEELQEGDYKWVSTGLITFYLLAAIAIGAMVLSGIKKLIK